eukprot:TRINITY_DN5107_c0_g1_i1.p1 TRINITY_DN5107_c0_g1~~TRINITY_DN5107_c0_g1_i1.p1  ORF type:complete len:472 (-),score=106.52 TRINITY_DN5107_c0_g1_i1:305-1660(-)
MSSKKIVDDNSQDEEEVTSEETTGEESSDADIQQHSDDEVDQKPVRRLMLPMMAMFQAYGAYVVMQRFLKGRLHAHHAEDAERAELFTLSTTLMHWGKLVVRVGHEVLLAPFTTRQRVLISMVVTGIAVAVVPLFVYIGGSTWIGWAFVHFTLLGLGVGVFEVTYLSVISPLGKLTKAWAIMGIPIGLALVDIVGQLICSKAIVGQEGHDNNPQIIYWYIVLCLPPTMYIFASKAPSESASVHQSSIVDACRHIKKWGGKMAPFFVAKLIGNFVMENTPGWFYVYNGPKVPLINPEDTEPTMDSDMFFCVIYVLVMLGDALSRRVLYCLPLDTKTAYLITIGVAILTSCVGFWMESLLHAWATMIAAFLAFWGNGMTYAVATKFIDASLDQEYSRAVYGIWTMVGDVGSIIGAGAVDVVNEFFCSESYTYVCVGYNNITEVAAELANATAA